MENIKLNPVQVILIGGESALVRRAAVNALSMIGDQRALPAFKQAAAAVAERVREVIGEIGPDAEPWWPKLRQKR